MPAIKSQKFLINSSSKVSSSGFNQDTSFGQTKMSLQQEKKT
jgi:hypothetical protein